MSKNPYELVIEEKGKLPEVSEVGGYPLFYITMANEILCPKCAVNYADEIESHQVYWEGAPMGCDGECGGVIESAYGDLTLDGDLDTEG